MMSSFHSVSKAHLYRYSAKFDFSYNYCKDTDWERAEALLKGAKGKRLMHHQSCETANA